MNYIHGLARNDSELFSHNVLDNTTFESICKKYLLCIMYYQKENQLNLYTDFIIKYLKYLLR